MYHRRIEVFLHICAAKVSQSSWILFSAVELWLSDADRWLLLLDAMVRLPCRCSYAAQKRNFWTKPSKGWIRTRILCLVRQSFWQRGDSRELCATISDIFLCLIITSHSTNFFTLFSLPHFLCLHSWLLHMHSALCCHWWTSLTSRSKL